MTQKTADRILIVLFLPLWLPVQIMDWMGLVKRIDRWLEARTLNNDPAKMDMEYFLKLNEEAKKRYETRRNHQ